MPNMTLLLDILPQGPQTRGSLRILSFSQNFLVGGDDMPVYYCVMCIVLCPTAIPEFTLTVSLNLC